MRTWQKITLVAIVLMMIGLIWVFWDTAFSIILASGLLMILPIYLFNRFLNTDRTSDFVEDDNG